MVTTPSKIGMDAPLAMQSSNLDERFRVLHVKMETRSKEYVQHIESLFQHAEQLKQENEGLRAQMVRR